MLEIPVSGRVLLHLFLTEDLGGLLLKSLVGFPQFVLWVWYPMALHPTWPLAKPLRPHRQNGETNRAYLPGSDEIMHPKELCIVPNT